MTKIIADILERNGIPGAASTLVTGGKDLGEAIVNDADIPLGEVFMVPVFLICTISFLVSFTGSEAVGRLVGRAVQSRFGKTILELGGNNGMDFGSLMTDPRYLASLFGSQSSNSFNYHA